LNRKGNYPLKVMRGHTLDNKRQEAKLFASSIDAAALQADISKRYNLSGRSSSLTSSINSSGIIKYKRKKSEKIEIKALKCQSCQHNNDIKRNQLPICENCGYYMSGPQQSRESLSQMRGLVPPSPAVSVMSLAEWNKVECKLENRKDAFCPICMEPFKGHEVLLSCSHMFHRFQQPNIITTHS
jgi:hypothetical protein